MSKICATCDKTIVWPDIFNCYYCQNSFCDEHSQAENHNCPKVMSAKHIDQGYLRKKGVNITTGRYKTVCKQCGFQSDFMGIEDANGLRIDHIKEKGCDGNSVKLRQHEEDRKADDEFIAKLTPEESGNMWMYDCLGAAKSVIMQHHSAEGLTEFFKMAKFSISIQTDKGYAYGYIDGTNPFYRIGIHKALEVETDESYKMVTVVLIHEILHALHDDWSESQVSGEEKKLANLGLHFDALHNLDLLYLSGKMRLCSE